MTLAFQIIRAAHASGTHHKLAIDALALLSGPNANRWQRLFLSNATLYLEGSKAPDKEFKDFKNHVLHPSDDYWGGAPEKARNWYRHLLEALKSRNWSEAAWCAGILSHYYTDPIQPFHTAQSEAENAIHRAAEWSISKSYDALVAEALARNSPGARQPGISDHWLQDYVCLGAEKAHAHYERLIAHYDISAGVVEPEKGFDAVGRRAIGELLVYARSGFAQILDRAFLEAEASPPEVNLSAKSILAALGMPIAWVVKRMEDAASRREVEAMYDELMETGRVEKTLPEDDRVVRDLHQQEVLAGRTAARAAERAKRIRSGQERHARQSLFAMSPASGRAANHPKPSSEVSAPHARASEASKSPEYRPQGEQGSSAALSGLRPDWQRYFLALTDDIEVAPSIGPKTAARLAPIGLLKVSDLMEADPEKVAADLSDKRITGATVAAWQDESRLMLSIPGLRVTQSQLLVASGYRFAEAIAEAKPDELSAGILAFATTPSGQRLLRNGDPPDIERIKSWIDAAHASSRAA
jgi:Domain of unknown function (DUF4332)/Zinc dependent phospholipase C